MDELDDIYIPGIDDAQKYLDQQSRSIIIKHLKFSNNTRKLAILRSLISTAEQILLETQEETMMDLLNPRNKLKPSDPPF